MEYVLPVLGGIAIYGFIAYLVIRIAGFNRLTDNE
jgi:hypothetical protein